MKRYIRSDTQSKKESPEFDIGENGKLYEYRGNSRIVYVPSGVKDISDGAFEFNKTIQKVVLPEGVENIYYDAFYGCESLKSIVFPSSLQFIGADAFHSCSSLEQLTIPAKVTQLYNRAFEGATGVKIKYEIGPRRAGDLPEFWADAGKAAQVLGWKTTRNLQDMCRDTWNWQSKNPNGYEI